MRSIAGSRSRSPWSRPPSITWYEGYVLASGSSASVTYQVARQALSTTTSTASVKVRLPRRELHQQSAPLFDPGERQHGLGAFGLERVRGVHARVDNGPANFSQSILNDGSPDTTNVTVTLPLGRCTGTPCPGRHRSRPISWTRTGSRSITDGSSRQDRTTSSRSRFRIRTRRSRSRTSRRTRARSTRSRARSPAPPRQTGPDHRRTSRGTGPYRVESTCSSTPTLPPGSLRRFVVLRAQRERAMGDLLPAAVRPRPQSYLRNPPTGADWLVVYNASVVERAHRVGSASSKGGPNQGLRVVTVDVEDVYDEFSFGIQDPQGNP